MTICVDQFGNQCDCDQPGAIVADGGIVRASMLHLDSAQRSVSSVPAADWHGDPDRELADAQARYERRIADGWKRPTDPASNGTTDASTTGSGDYMARYESRLTSAWRGGAA